jgi:peptide chain release factor 1
MDYSPIIEKKRSRLGELEEQIANPDFYSDPKRAGEVMQEHKRLKKLIEMGAAHHESIKALADNRELANDEDEEMAAMAAEEIPELEDKIERMGAEIQYALLPRDKTEDRDAIVEVRAGTGGDEASLFAADLMRMYQRYGEARGWKIEPLETSPSDVGGFKEITFKVSGEEVFRYLKYESGVHRVQRVPETETQGRVHTSTATVAVLPEAEDVDVELKQDEIRIDVCRAGGPGGQGVNTTDSAVQVLHIPTGMIVRCQDGRSQQKNKEKALTILRSRLLEAATQEQADEYSSQRRSLIGSAGREEKIRTYNFPQNRLTDHRIGLTLYSLEQVMQGQIEELVEQLQASDIEERLKTEGLEVS